VGKDKQCPDSRSIATSYIKIDFCDRYAFYPIRLPTTKISIRHALPVSSTNRFPLQRHRDCSIPHQKKLSVSSNGSFSLQLSFPSRRRSCLKTFSILIRIVLSATLDEIHYENIQKKTFSILIRIVLSATALAEWNLTESLLNFQYPHTDRSLCNRITLLYRSKVVGTFSILIRIVLSATRRSRSREEGHIGHFSLARAFF
jgi:hypothetical protein